MTDFHRALKFIYPDLKDDEYQLQTQGVTMFRKWSRPEPKPDLIKILPLAQLCFELNKLEADLANLLNAIQADAKKLL